LSDTASHTSSEPSSSRSKAELWNEVKILTFTRALTIFYGAALLSLLTHTQLSLLGRSKYVASVRALRAEERAREQTEVDASVAGMFFSFGGASSYLEPQEEEDVQEEAEDAERAFLSLSWWLAHEGWRLLAPRVRAAVEETFNGVSLKTELSPTDLRALLSSARDKIEEDMTPLLETTLPPPSSLAHVLESTSLPPQTHIPLLHETRAWLASADARHTLRGMLGQGFAALAEGVVGEERQRLAAALPGVARWCHLAVNGYPNALIDSVGAAPELSAYCCVVFGSWDGAV